VLDAAETEHVLEFGDCLSSTVLQDVVDVIDDGLDVRAAVLGKALLDWLEVLPEVVDCLDDGTRGGVGPKRAWGCACCPCGECS